MQKNKLLTLFAVLTTALLFSHAASAAIWRVNNKSNYNAVLFKYGENFGGNYDHPVFSQIIDALPPASNRFTEGDTLHIEGSDVVYADVTLYHKVVLIGAGYFLNKNPKSSANQLFSWMHYLSFQTGSEGSQIMGLCCSGGSNDYIKIWVDSITIRRCFIARSIHIEGTLSMMDISQNYFSNATTEHILDVDGAANVTDLVFNNNICQRNLDWSSQILQCNNNTFDCANIAIQTPEFYNNIIIQSTTTVSIVGTNNVQYCTATNNLLLGISVPYTDVPQMYGSAAALFPYYNSTTDSAYLVNPTSAYNTDGSNGFKRGAYGGPPQSKYVQSCLAPIPAVYEAFTTGAADQMQGLPVRIKARTIK